MDRLKELQGIQKYTQQVLSERGFDDETIEQKYLLFVEEVGELAKAIRKHAGIKIDKSHQQFAIEEELADVFMYLLDISNKLGISLEESFWLKEDQNIERIWEHEHDSKKNN